DDCTAGGFCDASACKRKLSNGDACTGNKACASGTCVDGVCCDQGCTGQCQACDRAPSKGICTPGWGVPHGTRPKCVTSNEVCAGTCDGINGAACTYASTTKSCGATCTDGKAVESTCDGQGACTAGAPKLCAPYVCADATQCKVSCEK